MQVTNSGSGPRGRILEVRKDPSVTYISKVSLFDAQLHLKRVMGAEGIHLTWLRTEHQTGKVFLMYAPGSGVVPEEAATFRRLHEALDIFSQAALARATDDSKPGRTGYWFRMPPEDRGGFRVAAGIWSVEHKSKTKLHEVTIATNLHATFGRLDLLPLLTAKYTPCSYELTWQGQQFVEGATLQHFVVPSHALKGVSLSVVVNDMENSDWVSLFERWNSPT